MAVQARRSAKEAASLGVRIYSEEIKPLLHPQDENKFVAIDLNSRAFELDEDDYTAVARLKARQPGADVWLERVGHPAAYQIRIAR
jgi:hypothetical protein